MTDLPIHRPTGIGWEMGGSGEWVTKPLLPFGQTTSPLLQQPESSEDYNGLLGGEVNVCQTEDDLKEIVGMDMEFAKAHGDKWPNVIDLGHVMGSMRLPQREE